MEFENHEAFFMACHDQWIQPMQFGECFHPVTVEELYQHFRARMKAEETIIAEEE